MPVIPVLCHETDLPTQQNQAQEDARFPRSDENQSRAAGDQGQARKRPQAIDGLTDKQARALAFSADDRVKERRDFQSLLSARCKSSDRSVMVLACPNGLTRARLGIAVPKKQVRLAVNRNRLKRRVREFFRRHKPKLAGFDTLVIVRKPACELTGIQFHDLLEFHWARIARCREF